jgi:antitoxin (DNA-binding transcriptional repressor) of toxin-antitoxin stability system
MNHITTTDLRTKSSELIASLENGKSVSLVHRSKIVGKIMPASDVTNKKINAKSLQETISNLDLPQLSSDEIDKRYRKAMMQKHGKSIR